MADDVDGAQEWLSIQQVAERLGVSTSRVRQLIREGYLVSVASGDGPRIPADFVRPESDSGVALDAAGVIKGLRGTITLLRDGGYGDDEIVEWLYVADDTLPGTPIQALRENRGTEVKRRAQAAAL